MGVLLRRLERRIHSLIMNKGVLVFTSVCTIFLTTLLLVKFHSTESYICDQNGKCYRSSVFPYDEQDKILKEMSAVSNFSLFLENFDNYRENHFQKFHLRPKGFGLKKFTTANCEILRHVNVILYNRIHKTGSTSIISLMRKNARMLQYGHIVGSTEDWERSGNLYPQVVEKQCQEKLDTLAQLGYSNPRVIFMAHFYFSKDLTYSENYTYINFMRDPIRRYVSHYYYIRTYRSRPANKIQEVIDLGQMNETLERCFEFQHQGCEYNVLTRFFCGTSPFCNKGTRQALEQAKYNMAYYYSAIGLLEYSYLSFQLFQKIFPTYFPKENIEIPKLKVNANNSFSRVPQRLLERIAKANAADLELYEFAKELFWQKIEACGLNDRDDW